MRFEVEVLSIQFLLANGCLLSTCSYRFSTLNAVNWLQDQLPILLVSFVYLNRVLNILRSSSTHAVPFLG